MKTKRIWMVMVIMLVIIVASCKKESIPSSNDQEVIPQKMESLGDFLSTGEDPFAIPQTGNKITMIELLESSSTIIPDYVFRCYENYKWAYRHVKQPDYYSCSWTSYVICTGNIAAVTGKTYPVTKDQITTVKEGCYSSKFITSLASYANTSDKAIVKANVISLSKSSAYMTVVKKMMLLLEKNKSPFVTISLSSGIAHYVTVYAIHWRYSLTESKVYFTDSLDPDNGSFNANVKSMSVKDFLEKMKANSTSYYNFLELLAA